MPSCLEPTVRGRAVASASHYAAVADRVTNMLMITVLTRRHYRTMKTKVAQSLTPLKSNILTDRTMRRCRLRSPVSNLRINS